MNGQKAVPRRHEWRAQRMWSRTAGRGCEAPSTTCGGLYRRQRAVALGPLLSSFLGVALTLSAITIGLSVLRHRRGSEGIGAFGMGRSSWNTCNSKLCMAHFRRLKDSLNRSTAPCDDFYRFACGAWHPLVAKSETAFRDLLAVAQQDAIRYLEAVNDASNKTVVPTRRILVPDPRPAMRINRAERAYQVCLHSGRSTRDAALLTEFLANRSLSWPERTTAPAQPLDVLLDLDINWNLGLWFSVRVTPIPGRNQRQVRVGSGIVSSDWKRALDTAVTRGVYKARVRRFHDALRARSFAAMSDKEVEELRRDESTIVGALSGSVAGGQNELAFLLKQMQKLATPHLAPAQWVTLLNWHLNKALRVTEADRVLATNVKLLQAVDSLLSSLPAEVVLHQLAWSLVQLLGWMADSALPGRPTAYEMRDMRSADCFWATHRAFGVTLLSGYINTTYPLHLRSSVDGILMTITQTAINLFLKTSWIDAESRAAAVDKLRRMNTSLWPSDSYLNASEVAAILENFPEPREDGAVLRYWLDALAARRALLGRRRDVANAFYPGDVQSQRALFRYHYYLNELAASLHALRSPLFVEGVGLAVNMGGLGAHYAAALARAFDPRGVLLDGRGSASGLWWGKSSYPDYERRTACPAAAANGAEGGAQAFEGVAAIEIAYAAFNASRSIADQGTRTRQRRRTFLGLSEDQAFFVAFCQAFCAREPSERQQLSCTLPLKNFREFATAFTCPVASPMNPALRCGFFEASDQRAARENGRGGADAGTSASTVANVGADGAVASWTRPAARRSGSDDKDPLTLAPTGLGGICSDSPLF
ncbi:endothelin-converting enzyme-like 1 [Amblyomma americanum]